MALEQEKIHTIDDIYALPDGERAKLIDGNIYYMAPPSRKHQQLVTFFTRNISNYIQDNKGECEVYPAPFAVFLNKNDKTYVEPDISVICDKNKLTDRDCNGAPDWVVEIVSPSSKRLDYSVKLFKYRSAGVREYWIVDPDKNRIMVYYFEPEGDSVEEDSMEEGFVEEYSMTDKVKVNVCEEFEIDFSAMGIQ